MLRKHVSRIAIAHFIITIVIAINGCNGEPIKPSSPVAAIVTADPWNGFGRTGKLS